MVYVTSDLHGYPFEKFMKLLEKVNFSENDTLYILGDVIDRGNDGIEYLKWIMITPNIRFILGNHEYMFLNSGYYPLESGAKKIKKSSIQTVNEKKSYDSWLYNGGDSTLEALKKETPKTVEKIMKFLKNVPLYEEVRVGERDFVLVHGGLGNFSEEKELENYLPEELLWKRTTFNNRYY
jgi:serine/threonine protein phosphatase 1